MKPFNHFDFLAPYYDRFLKPDDPARFSTTGLDYPSQGCYWMPQEEQEVNLIRCWRWCRGLSLPILPWECLLEAGKKAGLMTVCSETEHLPFKDGSFERIMMVDALHHVY